MPAARDAQCTAELARLRELKREHIATFIEGCRNDIRVLWDALFMGEDERTEFAPAADRTWWAASWAAVGGGSRHGPLTASIGV